MENLLLFQIQKVQNPPSIVAFAKNGERLIEPAKRQAVTNPDKTIMSIKDIGFNIELAL